MLLTVALGLAAVAPDTVDPPAFRKTQLEAMSTQQMAKLMLPPDMAEVVVSHQLGSGIFPDSNYSGVTFLTPPRKIADKFCARTSYLVTLHPVGKTTEETIRTDTPARVANLHTRDQIALAGDCANVPAFAHLNSGDITMAMELLSYLADLRDKSHNAADLQVKVDCATDLEDDSCEAGPLSRLAGLKIEQAFIIARVHRLEGSKWKWRVSIPEIPGAVGPYAEVNLNDAPSCATEIEIRRKIPAPF